MPIRKHRCPVCGQKFARPSSVVQHQPVHTGRKGKASAPNSPLPNQARLTSSHLPPLDFPCVAVGCDRLFTTSSNAKRHHRNVHRENRKLVASEPPAPAIPTPTHIPPQDPSATSQEELPMAPMTHEGFQEPWFAATEIDSDEIIGFELSAGEVYAELLISITDMDSSFIDAIMNEIGSTG